MEPQVVWLDEVRESMSALMGGKGANLAKMRRAGHPVPSGFCITTHAFLEFLTTNGLSETAHADHLRAGLIQGSYPSCLQEAILTAYRRLGAGAVAVRSSATAEDLPTASFAGQQETFLNVCGEPALLDAIRRCWESLWTERAIAYRRERGPLAQETRIAVVVQSMVPCDVAGVAFSIDPLTGAKTVVIEAARGLGVQVVSGSVEVERYVLDRSSQICSASAVHVLLSTNQVQEIVKTVVALEQLFGAPQDVEWGLWNGALHLFQSRPITVLAHSFYTDVIPGDEHLWTSGFLNERFPQPVSPLGWTLIRELLEPLAFGDPLRFMGFSPPREFRFTKLYRGHPFVNVQVFQILYKPFPDCLLPEDARRFFPQGNTQLRRQAPYPCGLFDPRFLAAILWHFAQDPAHGSPLHNYRCWARFVPTHEQSMATLRRRADALTDASPMETAADLVSEAQALSAQLLSIHRWSLTYADLFYSALRRLLASWLGEEQSVARCAQLVAGLPNKSLDLNRALVGLATDADWQAFLAEYGHRSFCLDICYPTFREKPDQVKVLGGDGRRGLNVQERIGQREFAQADVHRSLRNQQWGGLKVRWFDWVLAYAQRYMPLREDQRFYWQKTLALQRTLCLWIGQRFVDRGWLERPADIFFVTLDELRRAIAGATFPSEEVARRRVEFDRNQQAFELAPHLSYPNFLRGNQPLAETTFEHTGVLRGQPVSPGLARGPVRIVTTPSQFERILPGDILVTHGADPGWTPIFGRIAGLMMEVGGQLSHGAVVAREYGLPAVAGIPGATQRFKDGQEVILDGLSGTVTPCDAAPADREVET
jgi:pyruvate,water dikinase